MTREEFIAHVNVEQKALRRFLLALCLSDAQEADDIAQETLIKAYLASSSYTPRHKFSTWLLKIAYNTFIDHQRQYYQRNKDPLDMAVRLPAQTSSDSGFQYQSLYQALAGLSDKERSVLTMFYMYGLSIKDIEDITHDSQAAIKKQLSRAREHMKTNMQNDEEK